MSPYPGRPGRRACLHEAAMSDTATSEHREQLIRLGLRRTDRETALATLRDYRQLVQTGQHGEATRLLDQLLDQDQKEVAPS